MTTTLAMAATVLRAPVSSIELWPAANRRPVLIRTLRPDDAPLLAAMIESLTPRARYRRFQFAVSELPPAVLARLTRFDPGHELALIATVTEDGREIAVGEARYVAVEDRPDQREFALLVADSMQGLGLGRRLMRELLQRAQRGGVERIYGDVLADNEPMLALGRKLGFSARPHPTDGRLVRLHKVLRDELRPIAQPAPPAGLGLLRSLFARMGIA
ncbi:MAG TPA: GNAT family N-acetyltransferase [Burkholderiaceae bacterium]|nr:GNAT family N-acetyltransferase [Burkholderiaceae bacterium]